MTRIKKLDDNAVIDFRFHDLLHTAATRVLRESNLRVVQEMLGHADPKTTARYAHVTTEDMHNAMNAAAARSPKISTKSTTGRRRISRKRLKK